MKAVDLISLGRHVYSISHGDTQNVEIINGQVWHLTTLSVFEIEGSQEVPKYMDK